MIVIGGTYSEHCAIPERSTILGSGLRAAAAIRSAHPRVRLLSAIDLRMEQAAKATAAGLGVDVDLAPRTEPVGFDYYTPLSHPAISGRECSLEHAIRCDHPAVLAFGMIEGAAEIRCRRLVLDPQKPRDLARLATKELHYDELAIVANAAETRALGGATSIPVAARRLRTRYRASVVVTKQGARGALVTTAVRQVEVGPHPTASVYPIGTGDAFAAGFAWAWAESRFDPIESARVGSRVAAFCASTEALPVPRGVVVSGRGLPPVLRPRATRVYLAAPFFCLAQRWLVDLVRESLIELGAAVFSPFHDVGPGGDDVAALDINGLRKCSSILALLDGADAGTLFEAGWATRSNLPVVGFMSDPRREDWKMLRGTGAELHQDLSTAVYRSIWRGMGARPVNA